MPQETNVYPDLTAMDNLWHHAALYCNDLSIVKERMVELLHLMNLWGRRKDAMHTYSGGMKRRLVLDRALLHDPDIILFDEPTLGVDVQGRHVLWEHIQSLQAQGKTFIVSTNNMAEAEALCDHLVIIDRGKAIALDTPENLKSNLGRDIVTWRITPEISDPETLFIAGGLSLVRVNLDRAVWFTWLIPNAYVIDPMRDLILFHQCPLDWGTTLLKLMGFAILGIAVRWLFAVRQLRRLG